MPWDSPLKGYENAEPLPTTINPDGKSLHNPPGPRSASYDDFPKPIDSSNNGFDFHIYYMPNSAAEAQYGRELHERIRREFPELRIYKFWDKPVGPHPVPMFEVNVFNPHQTGAFFSWLVVNRGPCSVLIHPNTGDSYKDHTELATWIGRPYPLLTEMLRGGPR
ncbi:DOPA-like domain-containing protein [Fomitopsis serialis]|uniref:DOPA-like domain-containing protein n=1 Tax=Fomitopsis serialis TaxID=139415 RepID=UPI0020086FD3|nr:DOPA-like domain-containing protein [Neoantrodia serialis]KAH9916319.1 DOPA-like domain-containing protein [Neoantrodia serialis]